MNIKAIGRKVALKDIFVERVNKKLKKLEKFFDGEPDATVTVSVEKDMQTVELMVKSEGMLYRAEKSAGDMESALDAAVDMLVKQIVKNKSKIESKIRQGVWDDVPETRLDWDADSDYKVVKEKRFFVDSMTTESAILQMNMLGHSFFIYRNIEDEDNITVVYKRHDDNYGILIPQ